MYFIGVVMAILIVNYKINPNYKINQSNVLVNMATWIFKISIMLVLILIMHIRKEKELIAAIELNMEYKAKFEGIL